VRKDRWRSGERILDICDEIMLETTEERGVRGESLRWKLKAGGRRQEAESRKPKANPHKMAIS
jgi:hypothetical protein